MTLQNNHTIATHGEFKVAVDKLAKHLGLREESASYDLDFETRPFETEFAELAWRNDWILIGYEDWHRLVKFRRRS